MFNTIYFTVWDCGCKERKTFRIHKRTQKLAVLGLYVALTIVWTSPFHFKVRDMRRFQLDNQYNKQAG